MSISNSIVAAIKESRIALGDLVIKGSLVKRVKNAYTPGSPISYTESTSTENVVISKFSEKEHEEYKIPKSDLKVIMYPESVIPEINDLMLILSVEYMLIGIKRTYAGAVVVLYTLQVRPNGL